jgi:hypothetical protein
MDLSTATAGHRDRVPRSPARVDRLSACTAHKDAVPDEVDSSGTASVMW